MVQHLSSVTNNIAVVTVSPGAILTPWRDATGVRGIVSAFMPGQEYGGALCDVMFGDVYPSGRLPITFPETSNDMNITTSQWPGLPGRDPNTGTIDDNELSTYSEKLEVGYRYYDAHNITPAFPFGHGLSYTTWHYSGLTVTPKSVKFTLKNAGQRDGTEVVQMYLGFPLSAGEPPKILKGFRHIQLKAGDATDVLFALDDRSKSVWDVSKHGWTVAKGNFRVYVGASSRDVRLTGSFQQT